MLDHRQEWLAARGIRFLFVVCPDKHTIYPEYLPYAARPPARPSRLDQLAKRLRTDARVTFVDLRPLLLANKASRQLYYRRDTHWTDSGALLGAQQIIRKLHQWYPQTPVPQLADFRAVPVSAPVDLVPLLGLSPNDLRERAVRLLPKQPFQARITAGDPGRLPAVGGAAAATERKQAPIPRAIILRDSFALSLVPYLSEVFGHATYLWTSQLSRERVGKEKPDVVIWELVERDLIDPVPAWAVGEWWPGDRPR